MSEMDDEKRDAINRLAQATAPLQWTSTGVLPQAVYLAESYIKFLQDERDMLLQAMFDARRELGFDTDGDQKFHIDVHNESAIKRIAEQHVREAKEIRKEMDESDSLIESEWSVVSEHPRRFSYVACVVCKQPQPHVIHDQGKSVTETGLAQHPFVPGPILED